MDKIGILTYHSGYNYGASLQAYALSRYIIQMGYTCEVINFETDKFKASREMFSKNPKRAKELIKIISRLPYYNTLNRRQELFDDFINCELPISPLYKTRNELIEASHRYDCIICGSDQIWNLEAPGDLKANELFFLNFPKEQKRISYAASFGEWIYEAPKFEEKIIPWLREFDFISVRETNALNYLKEKNIDCMITIDPTMLLDYSDYDEVCSPRIIKEDYILLFSWNCNKDVINAAKKVAKSMKLPVVHLTPPPRAMFSGISRKLDIGPKEFISMVKYASFVVTNSFHGTVFSTIFEKPYVSVVSGKPDSRMESLLKQLGLEERLATIEDVIPEKYMKCDWEKVALNKVKLRKSSIEFLKHALE